MAFSPFHSFRKHKKAFFAALTIVCMFTFVLSSGLGQGGDFFDQVGYWFGGGSKRKGPVVAEMYGDKVREQEVQDTLMLRRIGNQFVQFAVLRAHQTIIGQVESRLGEFEEGSREMLKGVLRAKRNATEAQLAGQVSPLADNFYYSELTGEPNFIGQRGANLVQQVQIVLAQHAAEEKQAQRELIVKLLNILREDMIQIMQRERDRDQNLPQQFYFGGAQNVRDTLDFMLWLKTADKMGITLTDEDVRTEVKLETNNSLQPRDSAEIERILRRNFANLSSEMLLTALRDEFRVRAAQTALTGDSRTGIVHTPPVQVTPYKFWEFYKDSCSKITVSLLPVKPKDFLAKVTESPTEAQLRELFDKYRKDEPSPDEERPGFKQPRRLKVQYVGAKSGSPYYQKQAKAQLAADAVMLAVGAAAMPSGGLAPAVHASARMEDFGPGSSKQVSPVTQILKQYGDTLRREEARAPWNFPPFGPMTDFHHANLVQPAAVAGMLASFGGTATTAGTLPAAVAGPGNWLMLAHAAEARDRVRVGMPLILSRFSLVPEPFAVVSGAVPLDALAAVAAALPKPVPFDALRPMLIEEVLADLAKSTLKSDLNKFKEELEKLAKKTTTGDEAAKKAARAELTAYIDKFVKDRGLEAGGSAEPRDQLTIAEDPGLKPLEAQFKKSPHSFSPSQPQFGGFFFERLPGKPGTTNVGLYQPSWYPESFERSNRTIQPDQPEFLVWKTEDLPARERTFDEAKPLVAEAWKLLKARDLAKAEADRLAKEAGELKGDYQKFKDLAARAKADPFLLGPMARIMQSTMPNLAGLDAAANYTRFTVPEDKVARPTGDFVAKLLELREKPLGETAVLHDRPKDHYYVAFLYSKDPVNEWDFARVYGRSSPDTPRPDPLLMSMERQRRPEMRKAILDQLRAEAKWSANEELLANLDRRDSPVGLD